MSAIPCPRCGYYPAPGETLADHLSRTIDAELAEATTDEPEGAS